MAARATPEWNGRLLFVAGRSLTSSLTMSEVVSILPARFGWEHRHVYADEAR